MKHSTRSLVFALITIFIAGCASQVKPPSLQLREYQIRTYEGKTTHEIFHAVLNTLQDDGFVIDTADINSGMVKATVSNTSVNARETLQKVAHTAMTFGISLLFTDGNINNSETLTSTITISPWGKAIKVRTSFVFKRVNPDAEVIDHDQITDPKMYTDFFSTLEKSIFYDENLAPEPTKAAN